MVGRRFRLAWIDRRGTGLSGDGGFSSEGWLVSQVRGSESGAPVGLGVMWATRWSRSPCYWAPSPSPQAAHNLRRFVHAYSAGHPWPAGDTTSCSHRAPPRAQGNRRRAQRATVPTTAAREVSESPPNRPETLISIGRPERHSWARLPLSDGEGDRDGA